VKFLERGGEFNSIQFHSIPFHSLVNEAVNLFQAFEKMFCSPLYEFHDFKGRAHLIWQNGRTMLDFFNEDRHENSFFSNQPFFIKVTCTIFVIFFQFEGKRWQELVGGGC